jgi:hypothetical protein
MLDNSIQVKGLSIQFVKKKKIVIVILISMTLGKRNKNLPNWIW